MQTVTLAGRRFVIMPEDEYLRLTGEPSLPAPDDQGRVPAGETARVVLARKIIQRRRAASLTQQQLAERAGVRLATLDRIERGQRVPSPKTVEKIDRALAQAGA